MKYVEAPNIWEGVAQDTRSPHALFVGGGITGCPDWQQKLKDSLETRKLHPAAVLMNPRRANFPIDDPDQSVQQIVWERIHIDAAHTVLFWFPKESICPIALFELGTLLRTTTPLIIGTDPEYPRIVDVEVQTSLLRPAAIVVHEFESVISWAAAALGGTGR